MVKVWKFSFCYRVIQDTFYFVIYYFFKTNKPHIPATLTFSHLLTKRGAASRPALLFHFCVWLKWRSFLRVLAAAGLLCQRSNVGEVFLKHPPAEKEEKQPPSAAKHDISLLVASVKPAKLSHANQEVEQLNMRCDKSNRTKTATGYLSGHD